MGFAGRAPCWQQVWGSQKDLGRVGAAAFQLAQHLTVVPPPRGSGEASSIALETTAERCVGGKSTAVVWVWQQEKELARVAETGKGGRATLCYC